MAVRQRRHARQTSKEIEKGFDLRAAIELNLTFHSKIDDAIGDINAERILKRAFLLQQLRVTQMMEMEAKVRMLFPWGYKNIGVLTQIGESLRKLEAGEFSIHGRGDGAFGTNPSGSSLHMPEAKGPLDGVNPDLLRAAGKKIGDLIAEITADLDSSTGSRAGTEATGCQSVDDGYSPSAKLGRLH